MRSWVLAYVASHDAGGDLLVCKAAVSEESSLAAAGITHKISSGDSGETGEQVFPRPKGAKGGTNHPPFCSSHRECDCSGPGSDDAADEWLGSGADRQRGLWLCGTLSVVTPR